MNVGIDEFFENTNILITGAGGYIGKVLIEKLLRSQPNVNKIYLLIRPKKGKLVEERAKTEIFNRPIFEKVKEINPYFMDKIVLIPGDILKHGLGISEMDKLTLQRKINVVYNVAASLRMKASLKDNIKSNLVSVLELLDLCRHMENLKSVVLVSTAYSNANLEIIPEKICKSALSPDLVLKMCDEISDEILDKITPLILDGHPNTYTFSKCLMENMLQRYQDLPIVLFRPAIVMPALKEPLVGWVDNINGPIGLCLLNGMGIVRVIFADRHSRANCVPVDKCTNALICSAAHGTQNRKYANDISVYNYACEKTKRSWADMLTDMHEHQLKCIRSMWMQFHIRTANLYTYRFLCFFLHALPALFVDPILALSGSKLSKHNARREKCTTYGPGVISMVPRVFSLHGSMAWRTILSLCRCYLSGRLTKIYNEKIYPSIDMFQFFINNDWTMYEENTKQMWADLTQAEQEKYDFDPSSIDSNVLINSSCVGMKVHIMKEKLEDNYKAVRRQKIFTIIHYSLLALITSGILWILYLINLQFLGKN